MAARRGLAVGALALGLVVAVVATASIWSATHDRPGGSPSPESTTSTSVVPTPAAPGPTVTLAFAGDVHFADDLADLLTRRDSTVGPLTRALTTADVSMVNLETAVTTRGARTRKELEDPEARYWFRASPAAFGVLERSGIDVVSMANNHGADYGAVGLQDSLRTGAASTVAVIGAGADETHAYQPYRTSVRGVDVAVLAADASPLESDDAIWDIAKGAGPGLATARDPARLVAAVRAAAATDDVVAVYLHWGAEGAGCPTAQQRTLARALSDAGADVVVGSHAHQVQGAGRLGDTYVSYGLGNFLWYNDLRPATGVLRLQVSDGRVVAEEWVPGQFPEGGGQARALTGAARTQAVADWRGLRGCTDLEPGPTAAASSSLAADTELPAYTSTIETIPVELQGRMIGTSHDPATCPVGFDELRLLSVGYVGFDGVARRGQLVVHGDHAQDLAQVFGDLYAARFPIRRMQLVDDYDGDDNRSMSADNTSAYNCRVVAGTDRFSAHARGAAVDVNPVENPYVTADGVLPAAGRAYVDVDRSPGATAARGVIVEDDVVTRAFARIGWRWGGEWAEPDFQHFHAP